MKKKKTLRLGFSALAVGLVAIIGAYVIQSMSADSVEGASTMATGFKGVGTLLTVGFLIVAFAIGCFIVSLFSRGEW